MAADPSRLDRLAGRVASVGWDVHPAISEMIDTLGVRSGTGWLLSPTACATLLAWVHPGVVHPVGDVARLRAAKTLTAMSRRHVIERLRAELDSHAKLLPDCWWDTSRTSPTGVWQRAGRVLVERRRSKIWVRVVADAPVELDVANPIGVHVSVKRSTVGFDAAVSALRSAIDAGVGVVDTSGGPRFAALWDAWWGHDLIVDAAGAPGWVSWRAPGSVSRLVPLASVVDVVSDRPAIVASSAADKVAMVAVSPVGHSGLRWYQDEFAEQYQASVRGSVCALPPGTGKTIAALAAVGPSDLTLVCAPTAVLDQWRDETDALFGEGRVTVVRSAADLAVPGERRAVTVVSYDVAVNGLDVLSSQRWDHLVVDEAVVLCGSSKRARALRSLRGAARKGLALTATPAVRSVGDAAALVAWARNEEPVTPREGLDDVWGPVLYAHDVSTEVLPGLVTETHPVTPNAGDVASHVDAASEAARLHDRAVELRSQLAAGPADRAAVRRELASVRLQLVNLVRSARCATGAAGSAKFNWCLDRLNSTAATSPALVFCDRADTGAALVANLGALRVATIDGTVTAPERHRVAERFVDGQLDVVVVAAAGQRGMNLQGAHQVIHLDLPTTAAQVHQRNGRAVRIGAVADTVHVVVPVTAGTIDEHLVDVVSRDLSAHTDVGELEIAARLGGR